MTPSASIAPRTAARITTRSPTPTKTVLTSLGVTVIIGLAGCVSDGTTYGNTTGAPGAGIYVIQNTPAANPIAASGSVLEFSTSASGAATPVATIANPGVTSLAFLAVDGTGNLYTTATTATPSSINTSILEYAMGSQNNAQPTRSIPFNTTTGLTAMSGLAVDSTGDIYASNTAGSVSIFSRSAIGSVAPASTVALTSAVRPQASTLDPAGNLYLATAAPVNNIAITPIEVFAPGAIAPSRTLGGTLTTLAIASPQSLATDAAGNLYVANVVSGVSSILVFEPTAAGNTPPLRDITGSNTQLGCLGGIALDTEGYLYVVSTPTCGSPASPTVLKFSTTGDGNIAPIATFTSTAWTYADSTLSIAVH